ncbi:MAG: hypothetical protein FD151_1016, partial [bacterium]
WQSKKLQMQGAQILRSEAYLGVRRNDEGCSATPQMDFLRSHQVFVTRYLKFREKKDG